MSGCHKKPDGSKWTFEEIDDAELFCKYESRRRSVDPKRPSTFLREKKLVWDTHTLCRNAADMVITSTHRAFRDRAEFEGQLNKAGGNADLIEYLSKEVVTNVVLRERLLKGIADDLPMKKPFNDWADFLRDQAADMDRTGKGTVSRPGPFLRRLPEHRG